MMSGYLTLSSEKTRDYGYILKNRLPGLVCTLAVWTAAASLWLAFSGGETCPLIYNTSSLRLQPAGDGAFLGICMLLSPHRRLPVLYLGLAGLDRTGRT